MSSRARDLLRGSSSSSGGGGGKAKKSPMERIGGWIRSISTVVTTSGLQWGGWAYKHTRTIGWWVVTTGMITALPLLFEVRALRTPAFVLPTCRSLPRLLDKNVCR
jgi:hypothetical protein